MGSTDGSYRIQCRVKVPDQCRNVFRASFPAESIRPHRRFFPEAELASAETFLQSRFPYRNLPGALYPPRCSEKANRVQAHEGGGVLVSAGSHTSAAGIETTRNFHLVIHIRSTEWES